MSCWVVPTVAAEIWGIPVELILHRIRSGQIEARTEEGFTFIDLAPEGPRFEPSRRLPSERPPTFTLITQEELDALREEILPGETEFDKSSDPPDPGDPPDCGDESPDEPSEPQTFMGDWRRIRRRTSRLRLAPPKFVTSRDLTAAPHRDS
jgi:hypothetical protein